jgi:hypothetical protein
MSEHSNEKYPFKGGDTLCEKDCEEVIKRLGVKREEIVHLLYKEDKLIGALTKREPKE